MIEFSKVNKYFDDGVQAVKDLSFTVNEGEFFVLIGPSGCGKTTTLKMINRLISPSDGTIKINEKNIEETDIKRLRWNIGYVLQQIALFPHMTIEENIAVVPELKKWDKKRIRNRVNELLNMVGLDPDTYRDRKPAELSGGQQQRVGVVRALAGDPDIILMDEPFSALDPISREQLQKDIRKLQSEIKKTIVFVTHDMDEALSLGNRICLMKDGETVQIAKPDELINNPADDFVKEFLGERTDPLSAPAEDVMDGGTANLFFMENSLSGPAEEGKYIQDTSGQFKGIYNGKSVEEFPFTADRKTPLREVLRQIELSGKEQIPVIDGEKVAGTVSYKSIALFLAGIREGGAGR
ncbi:ABC transporter ATP-binding protein [Evansella sp. LMS18]|uniref:ABC transporter ATP-binding protein n=1 Tax=Evansella sp. LMS18 TaxID=2924033 RepID=UPI0026EC5F42|nr:ABC transporter ATP-binding protein [Evansella sp. LMS18]